MQRRNVLADKETGHIASFVDWDVLGVVPSDL
jgi:hypothetical protein